MKNKQVEIIGARMHNLKNVHVAFPQKSVVVFTGVSGSGKSSLAFDTLYAEGQRRYVESLSAYVRQFMGRLDKPDVDDIKGLSPAIAIEQKVSSRNPRSTVGTVTEIYDYLKVLYARVGHTHSPVTGEEVKRHTVADVVQTIALLPQGERVVITCPLPTGERPLTEAVPLLSQQGYSRLWIDGRAISMADVQDWEKTTAQATQLVIDRLIGGSQQEEDLSRSADSVHIAFFEGRGVLFVHCADGKTLEFSNKFERDGVTFDEPSPYLFAFNNPLGACPTCEGFGSTIGIDPHLVIPNQNISVFEDAVAAWKGERLSEWKDQLLIGAQKAHFPVHRPYKDLTPEEKALLWDGCAFFEGIHAFFQYVESKSYKIQYRVLQARYRGRTLCPTCSGGRLKKEAGYVKIAGVSLPELVQWPLQKAHDWFVSLELTSHEREVAKRLLTEVTHRLHFLLQVGLPYITLNRASSTLSGGESQRIQLATGLGSSLVGSLYILDEPSIGLHPKDTQRLVDVLFALKAAGNTVVVVEHDELFMRCADHLVDIGPGAGSHGGHVVYSGKPEGIVHEPRSLTGDYLSGRKTISFPSVKRASKGMISFYGARENNLKNIDVSLPLGCLVVVAGVSGSGKSTLMKRIAVPALEKNLTGFGEKPGLFDRMDGDIRRIESIEFIDQNPIGKSSRSNPVTYLKAFDDIRALFAAQRIAEIKGFKPKHFSFNTEGGRCEVCKGDGNITVEMQFMADVHLLCEACQGKRYTEEVLEVTLEGKSIYDILTLTIEEAIDFFRQIKQNKIADKLKPLADVGLGYVQLGQTSSTLSGGEAQRVKLASFLARGQQVEKTLFVFDEPTTGLHLDDVQKLLHAFDALLSIGHSVWVIEHHIDVMKNADWLIELGPEGGDKGGYLLYSGVPEGIHGVANSPTGEIFSTFQ